MGKVRRDAASIEPLPYRREIDTGEAELVSRYASDIGFCIYAWNGAISTMFLPFFSICCDSVSDPQDLWFRLGSDRARLEKLLKEARTASLEQDTLADLTWFVDRLLAVIGHRNAIAHLGLRYLANSVAPDPYGKDEQRVIVDDFIANPINLSNFVGDLRVLGQYGDDVATRVMYSGALRAEQRMARPVMLFIPD